MLVVCVRSIARRRSGQRLRAGGCDARSPSGEDVVVSGPRRSNGRGRGRHISSPTRPSSSEVVSRSTRSPSSDGLGAWPWPRPRLAGVSIHRDRESGEESSLSFGGGSRACVTPWRAEMPHPCHMCLRVVDKEIEVATSSNQVAPRRDCVPWRSHRCVFTHVRGCW